MHVTVRESWTDERLDQFGKRIDERFDRVDERFDEVDRRFQEVDRRFEQVDKRFEKVEFRLDRIETTMAEGFARMDARIDSVGRAIIFGAVAFSSTMIAGFVAIATQI
jgi:archaellum component FlaC